MIPASIAEAAGLFRARKLSPVELARACLDRIAQLDGRLHAFVAVTEARAMDDARAAEQRLMRGEPLGPLDGIPFAHKDIVDTAGIATTCCSRIRAGHVPQRDAHAAKRLADAGTVLLGKLTTHEFALGGPSFDLPTPPARNPWDTGRFTGGSSSGSGAALAAGMVLGATGSDTMGSIRSPAVFCGITGLKPSYGLVGRSGVFPLAQSLDHVGPMARTAEDCALLLEAMAGPDPEDPACDGRDAAGVAAQLGQGVRGLRIGVIRHFHETDNRGSPAALANLDAALAVFRELGATVADVTLTPLAEWHAVNAVIMLAEAHAIHGAWLRTRFSEYGGIFRERVILGALIGSEHYLNAQRRRRALAEEMTRAFARHDVLITLAQPGEAPAVDAVSRWGVLELGSFAAPFNLTGGPSVALGTGFGEWGMPTGMQIAGAAFGDATVLRAAHAYQQATGWHRRTPEL
ncbi:Asp-tRNA(Asn)/Glu-tRNA(Gln) amidotransferase GatCAB subunit A [Falsiroseomonas bella]|uniref:Asp-tRNA(Asn)/Glu-tRNA(Gln) amidotransferase GatCAB subunit A n=1 Tax=Falsiroseomonas bella TaxID=2184016 RepID=A0A317FJ23_9PROT|nr:amidase [Falsiroseomonas bella]PWS37586.1 Asp-tRNA(Asn)/Glu-tRNA(Gln) amidotransferase GatCAB subunit A [Falsiroseomonas bella]